MKISAADLFCGAGGTSTGLLSACAELQLKADLLAINHWNLAIDTHTANHPDVTHLCESLDNMDPRKVVPSGRLDILAGSPECTHHSIARGGRPCSDQSRASAWHICRWAEALHIDNLLIENVREFAKWGPLNRKGKPIKRLQGRTFKAFCLALESLGYRVDYRVLNAADYGDATTRERLFIMARKNKAITWPKPSHAGRWRSAREVIDWQLRGASIFDRKKPLSENTLRRIAAGLRKFGGGQFVMHTCHQGGDRCRSVESPLPTVTCAHRGEMAVVDPIILHLRGTQKHQIDGSARSIDKPLPSLTTSGAHVALCEFIVKYHGNHAGRNDGDGRVYSLDQPLPTQDCSNRLALVEAFLVKYYSTCDARPVSQPLDTITTKDRFALCEPTLDGGRLVDVRFRMLQPHELARAMGFPDTYKFSGNRGDQVKQIGNAVAVNTAAALCKTLLS